jgi:hypothetical protein
MHHIIITDPTDGVNFAQAPVEESDTATYMGYGPGEAVIPAKHADRTFDWATDDAWQWADGTGEDHQVWHVVDGTVVGYKHCTA